MIMMIWVAVVFKDLPVQCNFKSYLSPSLSHVVWFLNMFMHIQKGSAWLGLEMINIRYQGANCLWLKLTLTNRWLNPVGGKGLSRQNIKCQHLWSYYFFEGGLVVHITLKINQTFHKLKFSIQTGWWFISRTVEEDN